LSNFVKKQHRHLFAALAGLLLALAFPNFNLAGAAWIAPALMVASAYGKTGAAAWRIGYTAGTRASGSISLSWLLDIPVTGFPILGWVALAAFLAIYPATWVWLSGRTHRARLAGCDAVSGRSAARRRGWRWK
jgi:apolipoprotein N-acyltransferase